MVALQCQAPGRRGGVTSGRDRHVPGIYRTPYPTVREVFEEGSILPRACAGRTGPPARRDSRRHFEFIFRNGASCGYRRDTHFYFGRYAGGGRRRQASICLELPFASLGFLGLGMAPEQWTEQSTPIPAHHSPLIAGFTVMQKAFGTGGSCHSWSASGPQRQPLAVRVGQRQCHPLAVISLTPKRLSLVRDGSRIGGPVRANLVASRERPQPRIFPSPVSLATVWFVLRRFTGTHTSSAAV